MAAAGGKSITTDRPRSDLDRLPQFQPDHTLRLDDLPSLDSRAPLIRDVLSSAMKGHVREARFLDKPTSLERFLYNARLAIATYESRSLRRRADDRGRASKLVKDARLALRAFQQAMERIVEWKQLDQYLESLFVADRKQHERQHILKQQQELQHLRKQLQERERQHVLKQVQEPQSAATREQQAVELVRQRERADLYRGQFRSRSPKVILKQLELLEPLLTLAREKLK
jgi:hypothetical protein